MINIFFEQTVYYDFVGNLDNSHFELEYYTDEFGREYLILYTGHNYGTTFNNGNYNIKIKSNLDKNKVINLCRKNITYLNFSCIFDKIML